MFSCLRLEGVNTAAARGVKVRPGTVITPSTLGRKNSGFMEKMKQTCTTSRWEKSEKLFIQKQDIYILTKVVSLAALVLKHQNLG